MMNRWPLPEFSNSAQERNFVYDFEDDDERIDFSSSSDHRMIRPLFPNGGIDPTKQKQLAAELSKSYSFHGDGAALVPSYVVTVSRHCYQLPS